MLVGQDSRIIEDCVPKRHSRVVKQPRDLVTGDGPFDWTSFLLSAEEQTKEIKLIPSQNSTLG